MAAVVRGEKRKGEVVVVVRSVGGDSDGDGDGEGEGDGDGEVKESSVLAAVA